MRSDNGITGEQVIVACLIRGCIPYLVGDHFRVESKWPIASDGKDWLSSNKEKIVRVLSSGDLDRLEREIKKGLTDEDTERARARFKELGEIEDERHRGLKAWSDILSLGYEIPWQRS